MGNSFNTTPVGLLGLFLVWSVPAVKIYGQISKSLTCVQGMKQLDTKELNVCNASLGLPQISCLKVQGPRIHRSSGVVPGPGARRPPAQISALVRQDKRHCGQGFVGRATTASWDSHAERTGLGE